MQQHQQEGEARKSASSRHLDVGDIDNHIHTVAEVVVSLVSPVVFVLRLLAVVSFFLDIVLLLAFALFLLPFVGLSTPISHLVSVVGLQPLVSFSSSSLLGFVVVLQPLDSFWPYSLHEFQLFSILDRPHYTLEAPLVSLLICAAFAL